VLAWDGDLAGLIQGEGFDIAQAMDEL